MLAALLLAAELAGLIVSGRAPLWVALLYGAGGALSFAQYGSDKQRAIAGAYRIPEARLHLADLCFGIIGGLLGQQLFRHKTSKHAFATETSSVVIIHAVALGYLWAGAPGFAQLLRLLLHS